MYIGVSLVVAHVVTHIVAHVVALVVALVVTRLASIRTAVGNGHSGEGQQDGDDKQEVLHFGRWNLKVKLRGELKAEKMLKVKVIPE